MEGQGKRGAARLAASVLLLLVVTTPQLVLWVQEALGARSLQDGAVLEGGGLCLQHHLHQAEDGDDLKVRRARQGDWEGPARGTAGASGKARFCQSTQLGPGGPGGPGSACLGLRGPVCKLCLFKD